MRHKKLTSPEKPVSDSIEYQFKQLLLPNISYALSATILFSFGFGIFAAINTKSIIEAVATLIGFSLSLLIVEALAVWFILKKSDIVMNSENISAVDYWYYRQCIGWQEITLVKQTQLFGIRCLSIKTADGRSVQIASHFYNSSKLLDRVRELSGEEHILVRALEKELSRPRYELTKVWCWVIGSIALTISIYLIGGNMYAAEQEKPLEQAIASYVRQHPKTAPNQSAIELQALMTKLGLSVEVFGDGSEVKVKPDKAAIAEWKVIEPIFKKYLDKQKTQESVEPIPDKLSSYLKSHQADIDAIEAHLVNNPIPEWGSDSAWVEKSDRKGGDNPFSKLLNIFDLTNIENLMIINILDKYTQPNVDISRDLAGIEKIQQSIQAQPSLIGQWMSRIEERRISQLVKQVDLIPNGWGDNLFSSKRHQQMFDALEHNSMSITRALQDVTSFDQLLIEVNSPSRFIPGYYYFARPHIRLETIKQYRETHRVLAYWQEQNICRTDGRNGVSTASTTAIFGNYNYAYGPMIVANQYPDVLRSDLRWELTTSVRQIKAKLVAGEKIEVTAKEFNLPSQVCSGESWTAKAKDGSVSIEFSHPPDWKALGVHPDNIDPLTYKIEPIDR
jgi:hypothetical protein